MDDIIDKNHHYERGYSAGYKAAIAAIADGDLDDNAIAAALITANNQYGKDLDTYDQEAFTKVIRTYLTALKEATCRT